MYFPASTLEEYSGPLSCGKKTLSRIEANHIKGGRGGGFSYNNVSLIGMTVGLTGHLFC